MHSGVKAVDFMVAGKQRLKREISQQSPHPSRNPLSYESINECMQS
jgi:hypothetical protein